MKKMVLLMLICPFLLLGCQNVPAKTKYIINEQAVIDNIKIKLIQTDLNNNNNILTLSFEIYNKRGQDIIINPDTSFKLYNVDHEQILNNTGNDALTIKNETKMTVELSYDVTNVTEYNVIYYSGVVENNIIFIVKK